MRAKAAICTADGKFTIDEIDVADPGPGEVLVRIKASGVCHTDHKMLHLPPVRVMGHEGAGVVMKTGAGVTRARIGDRVLLNWAMPCGRCRACRNGLSNVCESKPTVPNERFVYKGAGIATAFGLGTMSEATVVPEAALVPIDVDIPWTSACTFGCCVMTGYGSVVNVAKVERDSSVVVLGAGAVGICVIQAARIAGAGAIIAVDVNETKLQLARRFGATHAVLARRDDEGLREAASEVRKLNGDYGVDYAFECTSVPALAAAPLAFVRNGGTAVAISGCEQRVTVDMELFEWDKVYINPLYGKCLPQRDFPALLRHYSAGRLKIDEMVGGVYPLSELQQAFDAMLAGKHAKVVLSVDESP
jgi:S-(hydroxymethyl)glutathione dehydrogenase/alcohol dehydrogenase